MPTKPGQRGYAVSEELGEDGLRRFYTDTETDSLANDTQAEELFKSLLETAQSDDRRKLNIKALGEGVAERRADESGA